MEFVVISKQFVGQAVKILRGFDLQPFSQTTHVRQLSLQMQRWHVGKSGTNLQKKEMVRLLREWGRPSDDLSSKVAVADSPTIEVLPAHSTRNESKKIVRVVQRICRPDCREDVRAQVVTNRERQEKRSGIPIISI